MKTNLGKTKRYHHGVLREALLDAVDVLVRSRGVGAVTLRECARMAGVSHAAPLHHFRDHQALLSAYVEREWAVLAERMRRRREESSTDPVSALMALGMVYIESGINNPGLFTLLFRADLRAHSDAPGFPQGATAAREELVSAVQACTGGSPQDPVLTELAWSVVHGFVELQSLIRAGEWRDKAIALLDSLRPIYSKRTIG